MPQMPPPPPRIPRTLGSGPFVLHETVGGGGGGIVVSFFVLYGIRPVYKEECKMPFGRNNLQSSWRVHTTWRTRLKNRRLFWVRFCVEEVAKKDLLA